jgi:formylglycine-generating enzyme required for sulfatase activity
LASVANIADQYGKDHGAGSWASWERDLDDGFTVHAPVGSLRPNAFGLHDVHGNVWEWCRDGFGAYSLPVSSGDCERLVSSPRSRVVRGGGWLDVAAAARSSSRYGSDPGFARDALGLRPARAVTPFSFTTSPSNRPGR